MVEKNLKVLVADDIETNRRLVASFLARLGCQVEFAEDGLQVVEAFERCRPDVVLMDLMMPRMDGFEAIARIRTLAGERWIPIIILSALSCEEDMVRGLAVGADDYLTKPLSFPLFEARFDALRRLLMVQRALQDSLQEVHALADALIDGVITADERGQILDANQAACRIFGYALHELRGQNLRVLMPNPHRDNHDHYLKRYLDSGAPSVIGKIRELIALRRDGTPFPMELGVTALQLPSGIRLLGVVRDVSERRRMERRLAEDAERLRRYHEESEREQELAMSIMERQLRSDWLQDDAVQYSVMPARNFSGDVVAVARSTNGLLYALLADATGHGLAAAVSVLPALGAFYRMAVADATLEDMAVELNGLLCELLPGGRFVAAAMICLDEVRSQGRVWVGGVPEVLRVSQDGKVVQRFKSAHVPLGIVPQERSEMSTESFDWREPCQLVLCSDGLTEAENPFGEPFGLEGLERALGQSRAEHRVSDLRAALVQHLERQPASDDVSLLVLECPAPGEGIASFPGGLSPWL
ncbi:SpoIIE family protein phosphatase [Zoogloea sp.]|uniref:SpoIIE family protein phosphatase n=1 Tax=Zoogloea sp. TaxID=49181 RepID=UPI0035B0C7BA